MRNGIVFNHKDDISLISIINDINVARMQNKTVEIIVPALGSKTIYRNIVQDRLINQYNHRKQYDIYSTRFIFKDDFHEVKPKDYQYYFYEFNIGNIYGKFMVYYRIME